MTIHFEISPWVIEFWCHTLALGLAAISGMIFEWYNQRMQEPHVIQAIIFIFAIILTVIGAHQ